MTTPAAVPSADPDVPVETSEMNPVTGFGSGLSPAGAADVVDVIRHEQRIDVSTRWIETETVRISRRIVTETRMVPVEVRTEVLEVEHLPVVGAPAGEPEPGTDSGSTQDFVLVLHEEVPVVTLRVRPTERIVVAVRTEIAQVDVTEQLSSERIDVTDVPMLQTP